MTYRLIVDYIKSADYHATASVEFESAPTVQTIGPSILWTDSKGTDFGVPYDRLIYWKVELAE